MRVWLSWGERGLLRLNFGKPGSEARAVLGSKVPQPTTIPSPYRGLLTAYFEGEPVEPAELPVELWGTPFQRKVWQALRRIERGHVKSYAAIANAIGSPRGMRAVGGANHRNPIAIVVPCHRVIAADMSLGGYGGGLEIKRFLLGLEGCRIVGDRVQPGQLTLI
jgi:O-6-methylguanine DNA methyltransferase